MKKKQYDDDDGRVISNMNIEGMPWNNGYNRWFGGFVTKKYQKDIQKQAALERKYMPDEQLQMTKKESLAVIFNAILAVLLICGIFLLVIFLFILFCTKVWLK